MRIGLRGLALFVLILASVPLKLSAQEPAVQKTVDLGDFTKEIMFLQFNGNQTHLGLWLPFEFYVAAAVSEGTLTKAGAEKNLEFLKPYLTFIVQSSIQQTDGKSVYADEKEVRARSVLKLANGAEISPLDKVPPMVTAALAVMKTFLNKEGDAGSANLHILVFPATTTQGVKIVDTARKDKLILVLKANPRYAETSMTWRTPFDAVSKVPDCPRCKAGVSAKWSYCPYCGQKLPHE